MLEGIARTKLPPLNLAWLLPFTTAVFLSAAATHAQIEHKGPAASIALAATLPPYDVVSVKPNIAQNISGDLSYSTGIGDHGFTASNVTLKQIIELAYDANGDQIFGLSGPVNSARFDIEAKAFASDGGAPPNLSDQQITAMLIPLLADRFHLSLRTSKLRPCLSMNLSWRGAAQSSSSP
jgi:Protein of unknown function (DUF3738)